MNNDFVDNGRRSPLYIYRSAIVGSAALVAPERRNGLNKIIQEHKISLEFDHAIGFGLRVITSDRHIKLSVRALEFLWVTSYFCVASHDYYVRLQKPLLDRWGPNALMAPALDNVWNAAAQLLLWSKENLKSTPFKPWPVGYPQPHLVRSSGSLLHQADEIFLVAIAWIIHHEIGHIVLGHGSEPSVLAKDEEFYADKNATTWIMDKVTSPDMITKRCFGPVAALMAIRAFSKGEAHHPDPEERMFEFLNNQAIEKNETVKMFAAVSLQLWGAVNGDRLPVEGRSIDEVLGELLSGSIRLP